MMHTRNISKSYKRYKFDPVQLLIYKLYGTNFFFMSILYIFNGRWTLDSGEKLKIPSNA